MRRLVPSSLVTLGAVLMTVPAPAPAGHKPDDANKEDAAFAKQHQGFGRIAHYHSDHGMIRGIGNGERVNINLSVRQLLADTRQCAGTVAEEDRELRRGLDQQARFVGHHSPKCRCHAGLTTTVFAARLRLQNHPIVLLSARPG